MMKFEDIKIRRRGMQRDVYRVEASYTLVHTSCISTAYLAGGVEAGYKMAEYNAKAAMLTKVYGDIQDALQDLADEYRNDMVGDDLLDILELIDER